MSNLTEQHLAELIVGIARAQAALISGIESAVPGARSTHILPALQNVAHMRDRPDPTLVDLPSRVLINSLGRVAPDPAVITRDLERLLSGQASAPAVPAPTEVQAAPPRDDSGGELDFSDKG